MDKHYSCYGEKCRRCLYQPQISHPQWSKNPGINIGCDDVRHKTGTTTPLGGEIAHWAGPEGRGSKSNVSTKRRRGKRV